MKITIKFQLIRVGTDTALKLYHSINIGRICLRMFLSTVQYEKKTNLTQNECNIKKNTEGK